MCIYVAKPYNLYTTRIDQYSISSKDYEILTVSIVNPNFRQMLIICVYKPPMGKIDNCTKFIKQILDDISFSKREIWILGYLTLIF